MATLRQLSEKVEIIEAKRQASEALALVIQDITDSADPNGDVELEITRTKRKFRVDATILANKLNQQKNKMDADIAAVLATITII